MMTAALEQARASLAAGGVPVGAVLAAGQEIIAAGHNERVQRGDPVAHGEIACLRNAGRQSSYQAMTLYTTLSPCPMCTGAILLFQIPRVVVGEAETFAGRPGLPGRPGGRRDAAGRRALHGRDARVPAAATRRCGARTSAAGSPTTGPAFSGIFPTQIGDPLRAAALVRILGFVIGETFQAVLAAAQGGDEGAFSALWRDANPALLRYLRVIAPGGGRGRRGRQLGPRGARPGPVPRRRGGLAGLAVHHRPAPGHRRRAVPGPAAGHPGGRDARGGHPAQPGHRRRGPGAAEHVGRDRADRRRCPGCRPR